MLVITKILTVKFQIEFGEIFNTNSFLLYKFSYSEIKINKQIN